MTCLSLSTRRVPFEASRMTSTLSQGSATTAQRPIWISNGPLRTLPPADVNLATASGTESTTRSVSIGRSPLWSTSRLRKNGVKTSFSSSATSFAGRLRQLAVLTSATWAQRGGARRASHGLLREIANADQIVDREAEDEHPAHANRAPVPSLSQQTDRFQPAKDLLDALAFLLAHQIAGMPRGARIDRARTVRGVLRHVGRA